jgi:LacI family transcriptional regulator
VATIVDVARLAGVATSTVSHVLNRTRFVSAATTLAVEDAVRAVGYTPNTLARALARSTTNTVGLAISASANRYFSDIINAIEEECAKLGMMVLLANTRDDPEQEIKVVAALHGRRVDGIILAPSGNPQRALAYLRDNAIPAVMVDRLPSPDFDGVGVENHDSMALLVQHLVCNGHRRIGLVAGQAGFTTTSERVEGFRAGLGRNGLPVDEALISPGHIDLRTAGAAAHRMLARPEPPTAFVGGNNLTTIGIMHALRDAGLRVPTDIALVGFDDFEWSDYFAPRLTVMAQPCRDIGLRAASRLKHRIGHAASAPGIERLKPVLIVRDSCGASPASRLRS